MAWVNEIRLSGRVPWNANPTPNGPWRFYLEQAGRNGTGKFHCTSWHTSGGLVRKGMVITVAGKLCDEKWQDRDGTERERITVLVESISFSDEAPALPARPPITVAEARPITAADPITDLDVPI